MSPKTLTPGEGVLSTDGWQVISVINAPDAWQRLGNALAGHSSGKETIEGILRHGWDTGRTIYVGRFGGVDWALRNVNGLTFQSLRRE